MRATCPDCGDVNLPAEQYTVRLCTDDDTHAYNFRCPECRMRIAAQCSQRVSDLLVSNGAPMIVWRLPAELAEKKSGGALELEDLLNFHLLLATDQDEWFLELAAEVRRKLHRYHP